MAICTVLQLSFKRSDLKVTTMTITNPKAGLTAEEINTAMAGIITQNVFVPDGASLVAKVKAERVATDTTPFAMS
ncbi:hypothetical protein DSECCO2_117880 [anaerobic digester metagenome]